MEEKKRTQVPWESRINSWLSESQHEHGLQEDQVATPTDSQAADWPRENETMSESDISEHEHGTLAFQNYGKTIKDSAAYTWLLGTLEREAVLQPTGSSLMEDIRTEILRSFANHTIYGRESFSRLERATFVLHWCPWNFVEDQESHEHPEEALLGSITFTGSPNDAQAAICAEYLHQTWPSTGKGTTQLLRKLMRSRPGIQCCGKF